jgi:hypothetical protein
MKYGVRTLHPENMKGKKFREFINLLREVVAKFIVPEIHCWKNEGRESGLDSHALGRSSRIWLSSVDKATRAALFVSTQVPAYGKSASTATQSRGFRQRRIVLQWILYRSSSSTSNSSCKISSDRHHHRVRSQESKRTGCK